MHEYFVLSGDMTANFNGTVADESVALISAP